MPTSPDEHLQATRRKAKSNSHLRVLFLCVLPTISRHAVPCHAYFNTIMNQRGPCQPPRPKEPCTPASHCHHFLHHALLNPPPWKHHPLYPPQKAGACPPTAPGPLPSLLCTMASRSQQQQPVWCGSSHVSAPQVSLCTPVIIPDSRDEPCNHSSARSSCHRLGMGKAVVRSGSSRVLPSIISTVSSMTARAFISQHAKTTASIKNVPIRLIFLVKFFLQSEHRNKRGLLASTPYKIAASFRFSRVSTPGASISIVSPPSPMSRGTVIIVAPSAPGLPGSLPQRRRRLGCTNGGSCDDSNGWYWRMCRSRSLAEMNPNMHPLTVHWYGFSCRA